MKSIFILTGAGVSAESGIQTFRGPATEKVPAWVDGILSAAGGVK